MTDAVTYYLIPSISAISIKLLILWYCRKTLSTISVWTIFFFLSLFGINCLEVASFVFKGIPSEKTVLKFLTVYYILAVFASSSFSVMCAEISNFQKFNLSKFQLFLIMLSVIALVVPNGALVGVQEIGYSITRIPGPLYWILQLVIPGSWLLGVGVLVYTLFDQDKPWYTRRRACALIIASTPTVLCVVGVVFLMFLGFKINATIVVSFSLNILLAVLFYTEYKHRLFRFLSVVPATNENILIEKITSSLSQSNSLPLKKIVNEFELALIQECLKNHGHNKSIVAEELGVSRATLNRKINFE